MNNLYVLILVYFLTRMTKLTSPDPPLEYDSDADDNVGDHRKGASGGMTSEEEDKSPRQGRDGGEEGEEEDIVKPKRSQKGIFLNNLKKLHVKYTKVCSCV